MSHGCISLSSLRLEIVLLVGVHMECILLSVVCNTLLNVIFLLKKLFEFATVLNALLLHYACGILHLSETCTMCLHISTMFTISIGTKVHLSIKYSATRQLPSLVMKKMKKKKSLIIRTFSTDCII